MFLYLYVQICFYFCMCMHMFVSVYTITSHTHVHTLVRVFCLCICIGREACVYFSLWGFVYFSPWWCVCTYTSHLYMYTQYNVCVDRSAYAYVEVLCLHRSAYACICWPETYAYAWTWTWVHACINIRAWTCVHNQHLYEHEHGCTINTCMSMGTWSCLKVYVRCVHMDVRTATIVKQCVHMYVRTATIVNVRMCRPIHSYHIMYVCIFIQNVWVYL
jgi:hypothetical protein